MSYKVYLLKKLSCEMMYDSIGRQVFSIYSPSTL